MPTKPWGSLAVRVLWARQNEHPQARRCISAGSWVRRRVIRRLPQWQPPRCSAIKPPRRAKRSPLELARGKTRLAQQLGIVLAHTRRLTAKARADAPANSDSEAIREAA